MLQSQRAFKSLEVDYSSAADPVEVEMDRDHLAQLIVNISLNAAQAMPEGGSLTVEVERQDDQAVIRLSDTGPGIPPDIQSRIFDPFFTTKTAGQGTGLGLAICHRIVESMKGTFHLESNVDSGTTFTIIFPLAETTDTSE
jgi:signal transduction histidine kinase